MPEVDVQMYTVDRSGRQICSVQNNTDTHRCVADKENTNLTYYKMRSKVNHATYQLPFKV
jgi:hypothetical protein